MYLIGNTLYLCYRDQPVNTIYENTLFCENHTKHTNALCGQNSEVQYVKAGVAVRIEPLGFKIVNVFPPIPVLHLNL
jgi:hypothetical protein